MMEVVGKGNKKLVKARQIEMLADRSKFNADCLWAYHKAKQEAGTNPEAKATQKVVCSTGDEVLITFEWVLK